MSVLDCSAHIEMHPLFSGLWCTESSKRAFYEVNKSALRICLLHQALLPKVQWLKLPTNFLGYNTPALQPVRLLTSKFTHPALRHVLPTILPHIAAYRNTAYTLQDFDAESKHPATRYSWMLDPANTVLAFCKLEETAHQNLYLSSFLIHPAHRGLGVGGLFLSALLKQQAHSKLLLKVHEENEAAQRLYAAHGFQTKQKWNKRYEMERLA